MKRLAPWLALLLMAIGMAPALAHETPIALLTIQERAAGSFAVNWNFASATKDTPPSVSYPEHCEFEPPLLECGERGLVGQLKVEALGERYSAAVVQITLRPGTTRAYTLTGANPSVTLTPDGVLPWSQVLRSYLPLGFEHILLGVDHLLFVLGLMLLVDGTWALLRTITAFTISHSFTLAAVSLGWLGVPERPVNAAIALSIVFVGVEIIKKWRGELTWSSRWPWAVAFGFGLLHGFGFAGALTEIGLPQANLPQALLFFNVGVELGQVAFVGLILLLARCHTLLGASPGPRLRHTGVYAMGAVASFWLLVRLNIMAGGA